MMLSGLTTRRFVRADTPGTVPRVLAGAMILVWAKPLIDTTMTTNVAITKKFLFIHFSLFCSLNYVVRAVADTGASGLRVRECPNRYRKRPVGRVIRAVFRYSNPEASALSLEPLPAFPNESIEEPRGIIQR